MATRTTAAPRTQQQPVAAPAESAGELVALPAPRPRTAVSAIAPTSWQEISAIAGAICRAGMAPKSYMQNGQAVPEKVAIAIMHGMEVGLTPMAALQSLAVINGMLSLYGDGMLAVVRASGLLEDIVEDVEWDDKGPLKAVCKVKRKGEPTWATMECARYDAAKAGWLDKEGPWKLTPHRMMQMRARGWALRDKFADVLRGLRSAEEVEDMVDITPHGSATTAAAEPQPPTDGGRPATAAVEQKPAEQKAAAKPKDEPKADPPAETKRTDWTAAGKTEKQVEAAIYELIDKAQTPDDVSEILKQNEDPIKAMPEAMSKAIDDSCTRLVEWMTNEDGKGAA